uniref:Uncharacterized protein n=1 Tax=Timema genevievae TaxID=629358 RepID=A0A7R9K1N9_TIMGE|nr:unnamed protein product [Timema genevievae]
MIVLYVSFHFQSGMKIHAAYVYDTMLLPGCYDGCQCAQLRSKAWQEKNIRYLYDTTADGYEEFVHLDVGDAIDIVKSESSHKLNTQLCMDITRALTDKLINTTSKNNFLRAPEEPAYVKQLKQLRWDHLKHIQREVQRLEELERFLDSCSSNHSL